MIFAAVVALPAAAHAGFFSDLFRFFGGAEAQETNGGELKPAPASAAVAMPLLGNANSLPPDAGGKGGPVADLKPALEMTQDSALVGQRNPIGTLPRDASSDAIVVYTVQEGDTPSGIAERFGISLNTLLWANDIKNSNLVKVGDELLILPVTGLKYEVKKGDTIESIAKRFKGDALEIMSFNGIGIGETLEIGADLIIPDGDLPAPPAPSVPVSTARFASLPEIAGFLRPIIGGRNVRATRANPHGLHGFNGVDLSTGSCGGPVLASAAGSVLRASYTGWNGGYGKYTVIAHPNGTQTLYAHLSAVLVSAGQYVAQGAQIGAIGSTGNSTGCHLHFEIRGAKNPF